MVLRPASGRGCRTPAPCTRGDGPVGGPDHALPGPCSPHPRGWSPVVARVPVDPALLPAPARMVPRPTSAPGWSASAPRTRGDGPHVRYARVISLPCSPHPRGCSRVELRSQDGQGLLSAPAGMIPAASRRYGKTSSAPRTRRDGPLRVGDTVAVRRCFPHPRRWSRHRYGDRRRGRLLPAPAGMVPRRAIPRRRPCSCSPHPREWSLGWRGVVRVEFLLPAPAEMVPPDASRCGSPTTAPRTRGDGPSCWDRRRRPRPCSPHPRGWSRLGPVGQLVVGLLPAPAGMAPARHGPPAAGRPAPRTRGDGPSPATGCSAYPICSPHPRGWSPGGVQVLRPLPLLQVSKSDTPDSHLLSTALGHGESR